MADVIRDSRAAEVVLSCKAYTLWYGFFNGTRKGKDRNLTTGKKGCHNEQENNYRG
jgi:hypothetical protein